MIDSMLRGAYGDVADILTNKRIASNLVEYTPYNSDCASDLLYNAIVKNGTIVVHADIDTDGFGSAYVFNKMVKCINPNVNIVTMANKAKEHGISKEFVDFVNNARTSVDAIVILDSSTNNVQFIKGAMCNVVVVDHHEVVIDAEELQGNTAFGKYCVVTNMYGENFNEKLSGCTVLYYFIREMCRLKNIQVSFDNLGVEQWVAITLISDVIALATEMNQYFIEKLYNADSVETGLLAMMNSLGVAKVDKNLIAYKIAPLINSAIRGGGALTALDIVMNNQHNIVELKKYKEYQDNLIKYASNLIVAEQFDGLVTMDITNIGIPDNIVKNYCGVIAASISKKYNKSAYVYTVKDDIYTGSIRGISSTEDYRQKCEDAGFKAMGHKAAFGLVIDKDSISKLAEIMGIFKCQSERFISIGQQNGGLLHFESFRHLKQDGNLMFLSMANSRLSSNETVNVHMDIEDTEHESKGKIHKYDICGSEAISFDELKPGGINIYPEFSKYGVTLYTSNL